MDDRESRVMPRASDLARAARGIPADTGATMDALLELVLLAEAAQKNKRLSNRARDYERVAYYNGQHAAYMQAIRIFKERINASRKELPAPE